MTYTNPHQAPTISIAALIYSFINNRQLIIQMIRREVIGRYRGSTFGLAWSFFNPLIMLIIYTFVFSVVFKSRWGSGEEDSKFEFALILFVGMIVYGLFSESINRAPSLIVNNTNYVKKVVFPLEILPIISLGASLFHCAISFFVLLVALLACNGFIHWTVLWLPLIVFPLLMFVLGLSWFLSSVGVYIKDVAQTISIFTTVLMFLSPIFYPISALPEKFQRLVLINPLSFIIEQSRALLISGHGPNFFYLGVYWLLSFLVMWLGFCWFQKTRKGFSDVL